MAEPKSYMTQQLMLRAFNQCVNLISQGTVVPTVEQEDPLTDLLVFEFQSDFARQDTEVKHFYEIFLHLQRKNNSSSEQAVQKVQPELSTSFLQGYFEMLQTKDQKFITSCDTCYNEEGSPEYKCIYALHLYYEYYKLAKKATDLQKKRAFIQKASRYLSDIETWFARNIADARDGEIIGNLKLKVHQLAIDCGLDSQTSLSNSQMLEKMNDIIKQLKQSDSNEDVIPDAKNVMEQIRKEYKKYFPRKYRFFRFGRSGENFEFEMEPALNMARLLKSQGKEYRTPIEQARTALSGIIEQPEAIRSNAEYYSLYFATLENSLTQENPLKPPKGFTKEHLKAFRELYMQTKYDYAGDQFLSGTLILANEEKNHDEAIKLLLTARKIDPEISTLRRSRQIVGMLEKRLLQKIVEDVEHYKPDQFNASKKIEEILHTCQIFQAECPQSKKNQQIKALIVELNAWKPQEEQERLASFIQERNTTWDQFSQSIEFTTSLPVTNEESQQRQETIENFDEIAQTKQNLHKYMFKCFKAALNEQSPDDKLKIMQNAKKAYDALLKNTACTDDDEEYYRILYHQIHLRVYTPENQKKGYNAINLSEYEKLIKPQKGPTAPVKPASRFIEGCILCAQASSDLDDSIDYLLRAENVVNRMLDIKDLEERIRKIFEDDKQKIHTQLQEKLLERIRKNIESLNPPFKNTFYVDKILRDIQSDYKILEKLVPDNQYIQKELEALELFFSEDPSQKQKEIMLILNQISFPELMDTDSQNFEQIEKDYKKYFGKKYKFFWPIIPIPDNTSQSYVATKALNMARVLKHKGQNYREALEQANAAYESRQKKDSTDSPGLFWERLKSSLQQEKPFDPPEGFTEVLLDKYSEKLLENHSDKNQQNDLVQFFHGSYILAKIEQDHDQAIKILLRAKRVFEKYTTDEKERSEVGRCQQKNKQIQVLLEKRLLQKIKESVKQYFEPDKANSEQSIPEIIQTCELFEKECPQSRNIQSISTLKSKLNQLNPKAQESSSLDSLAVQTENYRTVFQRPKVVESLPELEPSPAQQLGGNGSQAFLPLFNSQSSSSKTKSCIAVTAQSSVLSGSQKNDLFLQSVSECLKAIKKVPQIRVVLPTQENCLGEVSIGEKRVFSLAPGEGDELIRINIKETPLNSDAIEIKFKLIEFQLSRDTELIATITDQYPSDTIALLLHMEAQSEIDKILPRCEFTDILNIKESAAFKALTAEKKKSLDEMIKKITSYKSSSSNLRPV